MGVPRTVATAAATVLTGACLTGATFAGGAAAALRSAARAASASAAAGHTPPPLPAGARWRAFGPRVKGGPAAYLATLPASPGATAYAAWFDASRTQLALYPGTSEPGRGGPTGPASIPADQLWRVLAAFNSGFKLSGQYGAPFGFAVDGRTYVPLQRGLGTVVVYRGGGVDVRSWRGGSRVPHGVVLARQNLPLIVDGGRPNPSLAVGGPLWGSTLHGAPRVWRTALGIDRRGNLLYVAAADQDAVTLAQLAISVGAVRAMELDINPEWPILDVFSHGVPSAFVPNPNQPVSRYLYPAARDFFAVYRRLGSDRSVPFR
jgi:hypothetical protein